MQAPQRIFHAHQITAESSQNKHLTNFEFAVLLNANRFHRLNLNPNQELSRIKTKAFCGIGLMEFIILGSVEAL
jgi:hypothetical protein